MKTRTALPALVAACVATLSASPQRLADLPVARAANPGEFRFDQETIDVGRRAVGTTFTTTFRFKNGGDEPILLASVQASGATVQFPKTPIKAGEVGEIAVTLAATTAGKFTRVATLTSNAKTPQRYLYLRGEAF